MRVPLLLLILLTLAGPPVSSAVYRCIGEQGEPLFSQRPCEHARGTRVTGLAKSPVGPTVGGLRPSERAWLEQRQAQRRSISQPKRQAPKSARSGQQQARQAYRCKRKRRDLEALNAELRRGYKASRAPTLHRRRQAYQDYLDAFCS